MVYSYEGKLLHKVGESKSRFLAKNKRKMVAEKMINDGQTQRKIIEDSVLAEGVEEQLNGGNSTAR